MEDKNKAFREDLANQVRKLAEIREHLNTNYNNDMNKDVAKILRHAEHVIEDHIQTLE